MRSIIELVRQPPLKEARLTTRNGTPYTVLRNPSKAAFEAFVQRFPALRGLLSLDGHTVWLWSAHAAVHVEVMEALQIERAECIYFNNNRFTGPNIHTADGTYVPALQRLSPKIVKPEPIEDLYRALFDDEVRPTHNENRKPDMTIRKYIDVVSEAAAVTESAQGLTGDVEYQCAIAMPGGKSLVYDQKDGIGAVPDNRNVNYMGFSVLMTPTQFATLAEARNFSQASSVDFLVGAITEGKPIGAPWLSVDFTDGVARVVGHEGRTRMEAVRRLFGSEVPVLVHIFAARGERARHLSDETLKQFRWNAIPQRQKMMERGPFFLPQVFHMETWKTV